MKITPGRLIHVAEEINGETKIYLIKKKNFNLTPEPLANNAILDNQPDKQHCGLHIYMYIYLYLVWQCKEMMNDRKENAKVGLYQHSLFSFHSKRRASYTSNVHLQQEIWVQWKTKKTPSQLPGCSKKPNVHAENSSYGSEIHHSSFQSSSAVEIRNHTQSSHTELLKCFKLVLHQKHCKYCVTANVLRTDSVLSASCQSIINIYLATTVILSLVMLCNINFAFSQCNVYSWGIYIFSTC